MMDGFIEFDSTKHKVDSNAITYRNIISPFAKVENIDNGTAKGRSMVDENYGYVYDDYFLDGDTCIYGREDLIPDYSGDSLANYGFLRVPFRKIPRILVHNRQQLEDILNGIESRDSNLKLLLRGQFSEYRIQRNAATLNALYGSPDAIEPSLVTSAARKNVKIEDILPSWMSILNIYIEQRLDAVPKNMYDKYRRDIDNFLANSNFNIFATAMAQHYGLPSVGLDVTPSLDVALFFALKKFTATGNASQYRYVDVKEVKPSEPPVIYIMAPTETQQLDYFHFKPEILPFLRPDKQTAHFMHTGWGLNKNFAATRIFMAIYLDPDGDYGLVPEPEQLFPKEDDFAQLVNYFKEKQLHQDETLKKFLEGYYYVE